jgi:glycosyltransferase involved in cell wall biosynthesis
MIDFIVPSIGRETITRSLNSLIQQTDSDWRCFVGFDGLSKDQIDSKLLIDDSRIHYLYLEEKLGTSSFHGNAGRVRNKIIESIDTPSEWIGFLDDDDSLSSYYVEILKQQMTLDESDCYVFRMNNKGVVIPSYDMNELRQNHVGISFCLKSSFLRQKNLQFQNDNAEDFLFLQNIKEQDGVINILPYVGYFVGI